MTPEQLLSARQAIGLTQTGLADALGMTGPQCYKTIGIWENGKRRIPVTVELAIGYLIDQHKRTRK